MLPRRVSPSRISAETGLEIVSHPDANRPVLVIDRISEETVPFSTVTLRVTEPPAPLTTTSCGPGASPLTVTGAAPRDSPSTQT